MNINTNEIYQKILNKNPQLTHNQIISIQNKIILKLQEQNNKTTMNITKTHSQTYQTIASQSNNHPPSPQKRQQQRQSPQKQNHIHNHTPPSTSHLKQQQRQPQRPQQRPPQLQSPIYNTQYNTQINNKEEKQKEKDIYTYYQEYNLQAKTEDYIPRISQPTFQNKLNRNEFENNFQNLYSSRKEENENEYENNNKNTNIQNQNIHQQNNQEIAIDNLFSSKELDLDEQLLIFNLDEDFNLDKLKKSYRKLSLLHHPDRGGKEKNFQIINKIYKNLTNYLIQKEPDKQFFDLKSNFNEYSENEDYFINTKLEKDKFNLDIFNKLYEENKTYSSNEEGYGNWKTSDSNEENQKSINKFEINSFNTIFQKNKPKITQTQIIEYQEPQPSHRGSNLNYTEILDEKVDSYTNSLDDNLHFTDYKEAHTNTHLINVDQIKYKNYNNVEQLEKERERISFNMDNKEKEKYDMYQKQKELMEKERIKKLEINNRFNEMNFKKINKLMISSMK